MNGAETILHVAVDAGITTCFANPGTTEMPLIAAMDSTPGLRSVLCLFEGVCTGAADGYARIATMPALTVLHLGPGLANGIANLHNARRAYTPVLNVVGEHATWHRNADPPLNSDIDALAATVCGRVDRLDKSADLVDQFADLLAFTRQPRCGPTTAIVPHDIQLADIPDGPTTARPDTASGDELSTDLLEEAAVAVRTGEAALILGGDALTEKGLAAAVRIMSATDVAMFSGGFPARVDRGSGRYSPQRLPYFPEHAAAALAQFRTVILVGELEPVSFFGYPGHPGRLVRRDQRLITLVGPTGPVRAALEALAEQLGVPRVAKTPAPCTRPPMPSMGAITPQTFSEAIAWVQPADAIVVDEGATSTGEWYYRRSAHSAPHTYLTITGGAIGFGMPCATGAAIAAGGRRVLSLQADGSAMYTLQALWTQAREGCDVTTVICDNGAYRILGVELDRAGITPGPRATDMVNLIPRLDWVSLARGLGVPAVAVDDVASLVTAVSRSIAEPGPMLIQARMAVDQPRV